MDLPAVPTLGYRGLVVEQIGRPIEFLPESFRIASGTAFTANKSYNISDEAIEDFVCGSVPKDIPIDEIKNDIKLLEKRISFWNTWRWRDDIIIKPITNKCRCAPKYEPEWWNVAMRQPFNNCYNYASNYRTDTFAQPGKAASAMYGAINCNEVKAGAIADELIDSPNSNNKCPSEGHLVALVIWPGVDFHWYRKDNTKKWSHKPGGTAVTNLDNSGNLITDPRNADRGGYTQFCTFMIVKHGHIKIK